MALVLAGGDGRRMGGSKQLRRLHATCALCPVEETLAALQPYAASGGQSLRGLAGELPIVLVAWESDDDDLFANANTPDELAALQSGQNAFGY